MAGSSGDRESAAHPSYPNPTIVEALCEVHFKLGTGVAWSPSIPGAVWKEVAGDYPDIEPVTETGISFRANQHGQIEQVVTEKKMYKFTHKDKKMLIQLSDSIFTLNILAPYPGWNIMKPETLRAWAKVREVIKPAIVPRIGLRYINRILRRSVGELPSYWLRETDFLPPRVLNSRPPFLLRLESRINKHNRSLVTLAFSNGHPPHGAIVFDIDCIREAEIGVDDTSVGSVMEDLHEIAWTMFSSAKTSNLYSLLNEKPHD